MLTKEPEGTTGRPPFRLAPVIVAAVVALSVVLLVARLDLRRDSATDPTVVSSSADRDVTTIPPVRAQATATAAAASSPTSTPPTASPPTPTPPPAPTDGWVQLNETMRTRCAPHGGVRLYLAAGETNPVGLLDDSCPA